MRNSSLVHPVATLGRLDVFEGQVAVAVKLLLKQAMMVSWKMGSQTRV